MAGIPSSAIKLYTSPTGGSEVTGGMQTIGSPFECYAMVQNGFTESLTTANKSVSLPYTGRTSISGNKYIWCSTAYSTVSVSLPAFDCDFYELITFQWIGDGVLSYNAITNTVLLPENSGTVIIRSNLNNKFVKYSSGNLLSLVDGNSIAVSNVLINDHSMANNVAYAIPNDTGRVAMYGVLAIILSNAAVSVSNTNHGYISFYGDQVDGSTLAGKINITKTGSGLLVSPTTITFNGTNGNGQTVNITSSNNWNY